jgi:membrane protein
LALLRRARAAADRHLPVLSGAVRRTLRLDLAERGAALALFTMLAAVPALLGALAVAGFVFARVTDVAGAVGVGGLDDAVARDRLLAVVREALPGVSWDPVPLAAALSEHRRSNAIVGVVGALVIGANLVARLDAAIRLVLGRPRRSFWRAAGALSIAFVAAALVAMLFSLVGPLLEWGLRLFAAGFSRLSLGWIDGIALVVAASQVLPIAIGFYALVRWSAGRGRLGRARLVAVSLVFGALWFLGQRGFSLYVSELVQMNAIYGAVTGVIALLLWLYYAAVALLFAVAVLAAWEEVVRRRAAARRGGGGRARRWRRAGLAALPKPPGRC